MQIEKLADESAVDVRENANNERCEKVYLVWTGTYSAKQVVAAFLEERLAERCVEELRAFKDDDGDDLYEDARIENLKLQQVQSKIHPWECQMDYEGNVTYCHLDAIGDVHFGAETEFYERRRVFIAYGIDKEAAIKNCADFRRAWIAANEVERLKRTSDK